MGKYKKCPRCELNWIPVEEELCEVCKAELGKASKICLLEDDDDIDEEERICPVCKVNYLEPGEDICAACREEQSNSTTMTIGKSLSKTTSLSYPTTKTRFRSINFKRTKKRSSRTTRKNNALTISTTILAISTITPTTMTTRKKRTRTTKTISTTRTDFSLDHRTINRC